jgi:hypothetical protein
VPASPIANFCRASSCYVQRRHRLKERKKVKVDPKDPGNQEKEAKYPKVDQRLELKP